MMHEITRNYRQVTEHAPAKSESRIVEREFTAQNQQHPKRGNNRDRKFQAPDAHS